VIDRAKGCVGKKKELDRANREKREDMMHAGEIDNET
jgi:hypothetical protein